MERGFKAAVQALRSTSLPKDEANTHPGRKVALIRGGVNGRHTTKTRPKARCCRYFGGNGVRLLSISRCVMEDRASQVLL